MLNHPLKLLCADCKCKHQTYKVTGRGPVTAEIAIVGANPGKYEVRRKRVFVGKSGQLLDTIFNTLGINPNSVRYENACQRADVILSKLTPVQKKILLSACKGRISNWLAEMPNLKCVVSLGGDAMYSVSGRLGITKQAGIPNIMNINGRLILHIPAYHPAHILRGAGTKFTDLLETVAMAQRADALIAQMKKCKPPPFIQVESLDSLLIKDWSNSQLGIDTETHPEFIHKFGVYSSKHNCTFIIPKEIFYEDPERTTRFLKCLENGYTIFHNADYDVSLLAKYFGYVMRVDCDTMYLSHLRNENAGAGLEVNAVRFLGFPPWKYVTKPYPKKDYSVIPDRVLLPYLNMDCYATYKLRDPLMLELKKENQLGVLDRLIGPGTNAVLQMQRNGLLVDKKMLKLKGDEWLAEQKQAKKINQEHVNQILTKHEKEFFALVNKNSNAEKLFEFNPASTQQCGYLLFDLLNLPILKKTKKGNPSTDAESLELLHLKYDYPILPGILKYRQKQKLYSTYITGLEKHIESDGRVRTHIMLGNTRTGRTASKDMSFQHFPAKVKPVFVAPEGWKLVGFDYNTLELRVLVYYADDKKQIIMFNAEANVHRIKAAEYLQKAEDLVTDAERSGGKKISFGIIYGRGALSIVKALEIELGKKLWTVDQMREYIRIWHERNPECSAYLASCGRLAVDQGYVENVFGRRRRFPYVTRDNIAEIQRQAANMPIQSTASDNCLLSLIECQKVLDPTEAKLLAPIHDELLFEIKDEYLDKNIAIIKQIMETPKFPSKINFTVKVGIYQNWKVPLN